jgi:hypothetical protein
MSMISGRGRYALVFLVVVGGLLTAAASCEPAPVKPQPPATGLSIEPTSWNFNDANPKAFTVTNNGSATSGTIDVNTVGGDNEDFDVASIGAANTCTNQTLAPAATCTVEVNFAGTGPTTPRTTDLVVNSDNAADGEAVAALTGTPI